MLVRTMSRSRSRCISRSGTRSTSVKDDSDTGHGDVAPPVDELLKYSTPPEFLGFPAVCRAVFVLIANLDYPFRTKKTRSRLCFTSFSADFGDCTTTEPLFVAPLQVGVNPDLGAVWCIEGQWLHTQHVKGKGGRLFTPIWWGVNPLYLGSTVESCYCRVGVFV